MGHGLDPNDLLVDIEVPASPSSALAALVAEARAMWERVLQRELRSKAVVRELLRGAVGAGIGDPKQGRELLDRAQRVFDEDVQTKNRMFYVLGVVLGVLLVAMITAAVVWFAHRLGRLTPNLAEPGAVISLFAFAGMGSLTSVLIRLSTIDLRQELRQNFVLISGAARPLVAMCFTSVVYVIMKHQIVPVQFVGDPNYATGAFSLAVFLCGFSERFATDLLDQVEVPRRSPAGGTGSTG
jgi:hypothetical protein